MELFDRVSSFFDKQKETSSGNRGPVGGATNQQAVDPGTLTRQATRPPALQLDPIHIWAVKPAVDLDDDEYEKFLKKFEVSREVYDDLGLAGQIAKKFLKLPYRSGKLVRKNRQFEVRDIKTERIRVGGLVCSSFVNIFGAIWFAENRTIPKPVRAMSHSVKAKVRESTAEEIARGSKRFKIVRESDGEVLGESNDKKKANERARLRTAARVGKKDQKTGEKKKYSLSAPQIYASEHGGSLVNTERLRRDSLIKALNEIPDSKERLYAVVSYHRGGISKTKGHVWLLAYSKTINDWVTIESTGGDRQSGGKGAGPGIYKIPRVQNPKHRRYGKIKRGNWYQAFDWGPLKDKDYNFNDWEYVP